MRDIAKLLFGDDDGNGDGSLLDVFGGSDADGFGLADRARRAGEWCGSTPGSGPAGDAGRGRPRVGLGPEDIIREFRP
jgi:hypothetical protein